MFLIIKKYEQIFCFSTEFRLFRGCNVEHHLPLKKLCTGNLVSLNYPLP